MARLLTASQVLAVRERARLDARASLTARLAGLPCWGGLAVEAARYSLPATIDELTAVTLTAVRMAAVALQADPVDVLTAVLVGRAAVEVEPATGGG
jgi:hypothetical protein